MTAECTVFLNSSVELKTTLKECETGNAISLDGTETITLLLRSPDEAAPTAVHAATIDSAPTAEVSVTIPVNSLNKTGDWLYQYKIEGTGKLTYSIIDRIAVEAPLS